MTGKIVEMFSFCSIMHEMPLCHSATYYLRR